MNIYSAVQSQYLSALAMLKQAIARCPETLWDDPQDNDRSWFKAYHALYYAHLYLHPTRKDFMPWRGHGKPITTRTLSKEEVLEYLAFVEQEVTASDSGALRAPTLCFLQRNASRKRTRPRQREAWDCVPEPREES